MVDQFLGVYVHLQTTKQALYNSRPDCQGATFTVYERFEINVRNAREVQREEQERTKLARAKTQLCMHGIHIYTYAYIRTYI